MAAPEPLNNPESLGGAFLTTHWSIVLRAKEGSGPDAEAALDKLCRTYWPPLYAFIRRQGYNVDDARELTQEFLSRLVHKEWLNHLKHQNGRFRSFLLTFLKNFLADERDRANALKRGGGKTLISMDTCEEEERGGFELVGGLTPEQAYEKRWAGTVTSEAAKKLREEFRARGKEAVFDQLKDLQPGEHGECSYAEIGARLGMSEQAIKNAVLNFRRRYSLLLRREIAETLTDPREVDEEIQYLMRVLSQ